MPTYLVIVESPAKAKTIEKFLGRNYKIEASMGHIRDLPKSKLGVDVENDFEPRYISIRGKGDLIKKLKQKASKADKVYLATDPDREGEAISWHLANLLKIDEKSKCRISFNEITESAVKNSIKEVRSVNMNVVDSQQARRVLDRIVGYKISPLLWKKVKKGLSAGRVQSIATKLIVDREEEIEKFISKEYWSITANLHGINDKKGFDAKFYGEENKKIELNNEEEVNSILKALKKSKFIVKEVQRGQKQRSPHAPFKTSTLQQEAARKLGFTTKKTMSVAQQLYEGINIKGSGQVGLITYMRTDSLRISPEATAKAREFIQNKFGKQYVPDKAKEYKSGKNAQDAHEAIRPSYVEKEPGLIKDSLTPEQYKLYKLVWERFVSSQMASAIMDTVNVTIKVDKYIFKASGFSVRFDGFTRLYEESKDEKDEKENIPANIEENQELKLKKLDPKQHFTQPPPRYTEASLVKALEENGIGRPSTYAPTIGTILNRGYIEVDKKILYPTELGKIVTGIMKHHFEDIMNLEFTANMEKELDDIEEGDVNWKEIIKKFYDSFILTLEKAEEEVGDVKLEDEVTDVICEKCGANMVVKHGRFGKFLACPSFPDCRNTKTIAKETGAFCPKCNAQILEKKSKKGRKYYGCENNPQCDFMTWDIPQKGKCPKCGSLIIKKAGRSKKIVCFNEKCDYTAEQV